jgi:hypothetical protein
MLVIVGICSGSSFTDLNKLMQEKKYVWVFFHRSLFINASKKVRGPLNPWEGKGNGRTKNTFENIFLCQILLLIYNCTFKQI